MWKRLALKTWVNYDSDARQVWLWFVWMVFWMGFLSMFSHFMPFVGVEGYDWITAPYWLFVFGWSFGLAFPWCHLIDDWLLLLITSKDINNNERATST